MTPPWGLAGPLVTPGSPSEKAQAISLKEQGKRFNGVQTGLSGKATKFRLLPVAQLPMAERSNRRQPVTSSSGGTRNGVVESLANALSNEILGKTGERLEAVAHFKEELAPDGVGYYPAVVSNGDGRSEASQGIYTDRNLSF